MSMFRNSGAINNVRVFTGSEFSSPRDVTFEDGLITQIAPVETPEVQGWPAVSARTTTIDGGGKYLIPGFINSHAHIRDERQLCQSAQNGVTTVLDMSCWPPATERTLRRPQPGHAAFLSAGPAAVIAGTSGDGSQVAPEQHLVQTRNEALEFVRQRVRDQANYIKIICEDGCNVETVRALVAEARVAGKITVAEASSIDAFRVAQASGAGVIAQTPMNAAVDERSALTMAAAGQISIPLLTKTKTAESSEVADNDSSLEKRMASVRKIHRAGVPVLAGTDAFDGDSTAGEQSQAAAHGSGITTELELLAQSGLNALDVLQSATSNPAQHFNLNDRGAIEIGKRADLVLLSGNPLENRRAFGYVEHVWCAGVRVVKGCLVCGQTHTERQEWHR